MLMSLRMQNYILDSLFTTLPTELYNITGGRARHKSVRKNMADLHKPRQKT
jgi:hypothetical protein